MDPFGTAALRDRVLAAWSASPARFREDANAEEDLVRGAYRDRLVVELAQNAADAAVRAAVPGRLLLRLNGTTLLAANVGAALDAEGVEGLSTLRASAKRDDEPAATVGRFGVGFAAVLAVTDEPAVLSRSGGVRWSRSAAREAAAGIPALAAELARRGDSVPVLRLPLPVDGGSAPEPYDTVVVLSLRDDRARDLVAQLLSGIDDALLLALPGLSEVVVERDGRRRVLTAEAAGSEVTIDDDGRRTRWRLARRHGVIPHELLADRPVEERARPQWEVTVAVPVDGDAPASLPGSVPTVVHAPTPTDEPTALPVLVMGTFPLDSSRRRVTPGPLADLLVAETGRAYADLAAGLAGPGVLALVPGPLGAGELDAALHRAVVAALAATPLVPSADGHRRLRPDEVVLVRGLETASDPGALARFVAGLPARAWWRAEPLRRLGTREIGLGEVVDRLAGVTLPPAAWRSVYAAIAGGDPEALAALPVPLSDGRVVRGPRGVLLPTAETGPELLEPLGLRVADPRAVHPLLARLGAAEATPAAVLRDPAVEAAVSALADDEVTDAGAPSGGLVGAVVGLVAGSGLTVDDEPWLARLPLPDATGHAVAAGDLLLPGSPVLDLLDADPEEHTVAAEVVARYGAPTLRAIGVRDGFGLVRDADVPLDDDIWHDLDDEDRWVEAVLASLPRQEVPPLLVELAAVRDLDLVRADAWPAAVATLAGDPATRPALADPAHVLLADGSRRTVAPYTVWWLRAHARLDGRPLGELCAADAEPLVRVLLHPADLDPGVSVVLGLPRRLTEIDAGLLLDRLADPAVSVTSHDLGTVYSTLASADAGAVHAPPRIRVPDGAGSRVVAADQAVVADGPQWLQLGLPAAVPGDAALADILGLDLASDAYDGEPSAQGVVVPVPDVVRAVVPNAPATYVEHDDLRVAGRSVEWWVDGAQTVHTATPDGLARGVAWATGRWELRLLLAEALRDPAAAPVLLAEQAFQPTARSR